jgi:hypothetical protein
VTLDEAAAHVGSQVVYCVGAGPAEVGVITSCNAAYVFVRYGNDTFSRATRPEDLERLTRFEEKGTR